MPAACPGAVASVASSRAPPACLSPSAASADRHRARPHTYSGVTRFPWLDRTGFFTAEQRARLLIAALGVGIVLALLPYLAGLFGGIILYALLLPVHRAASRVLGRRGAAFALALSTFVLLLLPAAWLLRAAVLDAPDALRHAQNSDLFRRIAVLSVGPVDVGAQIEAASGALLTWASQRALSLFGSATRATLNLMVALFGLYYLLVASDGLWPALKQHLPFSDRTAEGLRTRFQAVTEAMVIGILVTALLQGTIVGVTFALVGLPSALFWGMVTGIVSILPILGSALVWLPGSLVLAAEGRYGGALALVLVGALVASNVDNLARLAVYRRVSRTHPMITLVGAFAGVELLGIPGLLLGPLAITYFFELLRFYEVDYGRANDGQAPVATEPRPTSFAGRAP